MKFIDHALDALKYVIGVLLLAGVALNFVNVLLRYIWGRPYAWTEEVMIFGLLFIVMAGLVVATARDDNLKIDILLQVAPRMLRKILRVFAHLVWIGASIYLAMQSYTVVMLMMNMGQTSMAARIPSWIPHSFLLGSFVLSALAAVYAMIREVTGREETPHDVPSATALTEEDSA